MITCIILVTSILSCDTPDDGRIRVFVSILPQKYFVERIGGEMTDVAVMVMPGMSPSTYDPLPGQMSALAAAQVYFRIGVPFEDLWIGRIRANYPNLKIVDTHQNITFRVMDTMETLTDVSFPDSLHLKTGAEHTEHENYGHSHHEGRHDPHTWLSPDLVKIQTETICEALVSFAPEHEQTFRNNLSLFHDELDQLSSDITTELTALADKSILVFHPAWGYFTDQFGLKQIPIEIEGKEPGPAQLAAIIEFARAKEIDTILVQSQFSTKLAEMIAREINGRVLKIDPLAENYSDNLREAAKILASAIE